MRKRRARSWPGAVSRSAMCRTSTGAGSSSSATPTATAGRCSRRSVAKVRAAMDSANAIEARALTRSFKGGIEAVRSLDLTIEPGEVFGFLGPNGAGKTTTVRMLCTLLPPTSGSARVADLDVVDDGAEVRRRIGVALQEIGLDPVQ